MNAEPASQIILQARVQELERLSDWIARVCEAHHLAPLLASHVDLCLTEIVTNCIVHGYAQVTPPCDAVIVDFARQGGQIVCRIADRGVAFDPLAHELPPLPTSLEQAKIGGAGLRLVRKFAAQLNYRHDGAFNLMTVVFSSEGTIA
jgi:anti-sigma regulatory factor (Ser/Thr protein kinase)